MSKCAGKYYYFLQYDDTDEILTVQQALPKSASLHGISQISLTGSNTTEK